MKAKTGGSLGSLNDFSGDLSTYGNYFRFKRFIPEFDTAKG
jgi:hypothetical protein